MAIVLRRNGGERTLVPFYRPVSLFDEMDKYSGDMRGAWSPFSSERSLAPHTDIYEENDQLVMKTELPGIDRKDLDITLERDRLSIRAERKEELGKEATHHTRERYYGKYFRSITIPYPVKEDKISATIYNGVLELRLPKAEEVKAKKIKIKAEIPQGETKKHQHKTKQKKS